MDLPLRLRDYCWDGRHKCQNRKFAMRLYLPEILAKLQPRSLNNIVA